MKQINIDSGAQKRRKSEAIKSAVVSSLLIALPAPVIIFLKFHFAIDGFWGIFLIICALFEIGMVIPILILLKSRLKEIEGGEEDAASKY